MPVFRPSRVALVSAFDQARVQSPGLTSWALTNALLRFHLAGSDDAALGGADPLPQHPHPGLAIVRQ